MPCCYKLRCLLPSIVSESGIPPHRVIPHGVLLSQKSHLPDTSLYVSFTTGRIFLPLDGESARHRKHVSIYGECCVAVDGYAT